MPWWAETQTAYHRLHQVTDGTLSEITTTMERELSRSADHCRPKCGRRMDFRPEETERPDEDESPSGAFDAEKSGPAESDEFRARESAESGSGEFRSVESGDGGLRMPIWEGD
jgi:hypothetical protein